MSQSGVSVRMKRKESVCHVNRNKNFAAFCQMSSIVSWCSRYWVLNIVGALCSNSGVLVFKLWVLWLKCTQLCEKLMAQKTFWDAKNRT